MDLNLLKDLVKKYIDLDLYSYKEIQLNRRLEYFIQKNNITNIPAYCLSLKDNAAEREKFISYITINVTKFFRDISFFKALENELKKLDRNKPIKIWSAACSYGCEPYTLAIILDELGFSNFTIIATDIDLNVLALAKEGIFNDIDVKDVPNDLLLKHFTRKNDKYIANNSIKKRIDFRRHNLLSDTYMTNIDLIVCRNVVIYFTIEAKRDIYSKFYESLNTNGILFVGPTEHISNYKELKLEQIQSCIYKKL